MIGAAALLMALGLSSPTLVAEHDIPWFVDRPEIRAETLRKCHDDVRLARTPMCRNAEKAGSRSIGRPLTDTAPMDKTPRQQPEPQATPEPPAPPVSNRGKERAA